MVVVVVVGTSYHQASTLSKRVKVLALSLSLTLFSTIITVHSHTQTKVPSSAHPTLNHQTKVSKPVAKLTTGCLSR